MRVMKPEASNTPADGQVYTYSSIDGMGKWATPSSGGSVFTYAKRRPTSNAAIGTGTFLSLDTGIEADGAGDITWAGGNPTRLTVTTAGTYRLGASVCCYSAAQRAQFALEVYVNGVSTGRLYGNAYVRNSGTAWDYWHADLPGEPMELNASDYVEVKAGQVAGGTYAFSGALTITMQAARTAVWLERLA